MRQLCIAFLSILLLCNITLADETLTAPYSYLASTRSTGNPFFNVHAGQLLRWRKAVGDLRSGTSSIILAKAGDSTTRGTTAGTGTAQFVNGPTTRVSEFFTSFLAGTVATVSKDNMFGQLPSGQLTSFDSRIAETGTLGNSGGTVGGRLFSQTSASSIAFTTQQSDDTCDLYYVVNAAGHFTWQVDVGLTTDINVQGTKALGKTTISLTTLGIHTITEAWVSGTVNFISFDCYNSTQKQIRVWNWGWPSSQAFGNWNLNANPWEPLQAIPTLAPNLIGIELGQNDLNACVTVANFTTAMQSIISASLVNSDVYLVMPHPPSASWDVCGLYPAYQQVYYQLALQYDLPLADSSAAFVSFALADAAGYYDSANQVHLSKAGYNLKGWLEFQTITRAAP